MWGHKHNSLAPPPSYWTPAWAHTAMGWQPVPQQAFVTSQPVWLCWLLWHKPQAGPTSSHLGRGQDCREAVKISDKSHSVAASSHILEDKDMGLPLAAESCLEISLH
ncbi:hypothetical protein AMECASPLE_014615 [Ameca splendens]|uniref:Uncharacterized protein n=1 Tax=Ameca splendens TaxID=208324 RepID=A0ABV0ZAH6_9TELE